MNPFLDTLKEGTRVVIEHGGRGPNKTAGTVEGVWDVGVWLECKNIGSNGETLPTFVPWTSVVRLTIKPAPTPAPAERVYELLDDGTLDTVLKCVACGLVIRTNPNYGGEPFSDSGEPFTDDELTTIRIDAATSIAEDHECLDECPACGERVAEGHLH
jgi:hypothetical protein